MEQILEHLITETRINEHVIVKTKALCHDTIYYLTEVSGGKYNGYKIGAVLYDSAQHNKVCAICYDFLK